MFHGIFYSPDAIRYNLRKTIIPLCVAFPLLYGFIVAMVPIVYMWLGHFYLPICWPMVQAIVHDTLFSSFQQLPDYAEDCLFYAIVKNPFMEKYLIGSERFLLQQC